MNLLNVSERISRRPVKLDFILAASRLRHVVNKTPLIYNSNLSAKYQCNIYLKREDLQVVRSYKIRGAYNALQCLTRKESDLGVVCASAGNHAQGFAYSCKKLGIKGVVFMPVVTPDQKVRQTKMFGGNAISVRLTGDSFDDCAVTAKTFTVENNMTFIHPFDDLKIIEGQGTVGLEVLEQLPVIDFLFVPVGGGGLSAGIGSYFKEHSPLTKIIGIEPEGAPSMTEAFKHGRPVLLDTIDNFVDGASVKRVGDLTFSICKDVLTAIAVVPEGKVCSTILQLYNEEGLVVEPAGALSISALDDYSEMIKGKNVVCIVSGSNNDIDRMQEIRERSLQFEGLKHYFLITFAQRPGALKEFVNEILGPDDDIVRFEYMKKHNKEKGPAVVGIELKSRKDYTNLLQRLQSHDITYSELKKEHNLFAHLI